uniref:Flavonoid 3',5'-hydroxylase CYP75B138 n=1 Tax=Crocosmia x crocosmiiflora TaxID=1053288 RepID=CYP2_CROXC|nr:RecName: Full=Flavonoid 3',5'-hydroxylase CYP75B138; AltName: Full=Cytochrome P450 2; Short=CcCYP2; AltName: Full=Cytochrome P450 75B132 [Crocosmia x crocosmiiflora]QCF41216.1 flavonoid 3'5'-hydroxylase [Crocosmia x crocosmiiflora]
MTMTSLDIILFISAIVFLSIYYYNLFSNAKRSNGLKLPPGPKGYPVLGNLPQLGAKPHQALQAFSRVYGPLMRLRLGSVDLVVASSPSVAAQFLKNDSNFCARPPNSGAEHMAFNYHDLVFAPYGPRWRLLRKLSAVHLLGPKALDDNQNVREEELAVLARMLYERSRGGEPVNVGKEMHVCSTNALSRAMMGRRVFEKLAVGGGGVEEEEEMKKAEEFKDMVVEVMTLAGVFNIGDFVPWLKPFDIQGVVRKMKRVHRRYNVFLDKFIAECRSSAKPGANDLLSVLIGQRGKSDGSGGEITDTAIKALVLNLLTAGTDTSSSTIEWALTELIRHPDILKKAQQEIDSAVGRDRLVTESDVPKLPYLQAIVKENFRMHPATPLSLPRMSIEECDIGGYHIPKNSTLFVNIWAMGRDPSIWPDPMEFRPSRFLPGGQGEHLEVRGNHFELMPFGAGRRICAGTSMGIRVVHSTVATLIHAFDWKLPEGLTAEKIDMEEAFGISLQKAIPLMAHPIPRLAPKAYSPKMK